MAKLWGGFFSESTDQAVEVFSSSIQLDARMWREDILGSRAHALMLAQSGILSQAEGEALLSGLKQIENELSQALEKGEWPFSPDAEDIHSEIEGRLQKICGPLAGKLHTARSRNDQVATDLRLYMRAQIQELIVDIKRLQKWILDTTQNHFETILPGLTHMQHAQPVSLAHHLLAYFWMLSRDVEKLKDCLKRVEILPLGSAALAGTSFPIHRETVRVQLNFSGVSENSLDAVSDRDFAIEFLSVASTMMMHLSRWSEEIVLWSMPEFNYIRLSDAVTTGSSIMPQKKNPDVAELIRAHTGRANGALMGILTVLKALPLAYNRDLQEDKFHLFNGLDSVRSCVKLMYAMVEKAQYNTSSMAQKLSGDASNATDLADDLAKKGVPFREAHEIVGKLVRDCMQQNKPLENLTLTELKKASSHFDESSLACLPHLAVLRARTSEGGTGPSVVKQQWEKARAYLNSELKN